MNARTVHAALLGTLCLGGCSRDLSVGELRAIVLTDGAVRLPDGAIVGGNGSANGDAASPSQGDAATDAEVDACSVTPRIRVGDGSSLECTNGSLRPTHRFALCTCTDFVSSSAITVDGFDSRNGPFSAGDAAGSVGTNLEFYPGSANITGSVWAADPMITVFQGDVVIGENLYTSGPVQVNTTLDVGGTQTENLSFDAPCDCEPAFDIADAISAHETDNDNASIGLDPSVLAANTAPVELTLPCGRYYLDRVGANHSAVLTITGAVELYVASEFRTNGTADLTVQLASEGSLELFVQGDLAGAADFDIGSASTPGRIHIYSAGTGSLDFAGTTTIAATLYAPQAALVSSGETEIFGAVLVKRAWSSAPLTLHYDRALGRADCGEPSCALPGDCGSMLRCDHEQCLP